MCWRICGQAVNPRDQVSYLERVANTPTRGISDATIKQIEAHAFTAGVSLWEAMGQVEQIAGFAGAGGQGGGEFREADGEFSGLCQQAGGAGGAGGCLSAERLELEVLNKKLDPTKENEDPQRQ